VATPYPFGGYVENWVILFARTGLEEKLTRLLKDKLNADEYLPFLPVREMSHRSKGVVCTKRKLLFPGYIFIKTGIEAGLVAEKLESDLKDTVRLDGIYSILHYGNNKKDVALREKERLYWEHLFNEDFCVAGSVGFIEGDTVRVMSGPLTGMESRIKKINRHRREAIVEMEVMGAMRMVKLMLEVVERVVAGV